MDTDLLLFALLPLLLAVPARCDPEPAIPIKLILWPGRWELRWPEMQTFVLKHHLLTILKNAFKVMFAFPETWQLKLYFALPVSHVLISCFSVFGSLQSVPGSHPASDHSPPVGC
ncbi:MAG: hypothetical protein U5L00_11320 [Desulfovermiculus sp.]|nr:hypothetical protein [Desulfovermiculus sp.]